MVLSFRALTATSAPISTDSVTALVSQYLGATGFAGDMIREMANYPPQRQSLSRSGRVSQRQYRRTGALGRNWRLDGPRQTPTGISAGASNRVVSPKGRPYAVYVEGPVPGTGIGRRQTAVMRAKGWPNITNRVAFVWPKYRVRIVRVLTQRDPGVRRQPLGR